MKYPSDIPFQHLIDALVDGETRLHPRFLYRLSDLEDRDLETLKAAWPKVPAWRRQALLEDVELLSEQDYLLSFVSFACFAAQDEDPKVRQHAVRTLWEYDAPEQIPLIMSLLVSDEDAEVRAAAAGALGPYVFAGEIEELSADVLKEIEDLLLQVANSDQPALVRRHALEALGFSSRDEVPALIESANQSSDREWIVSALFAMGRSANEIWHPQVLERLEDRLPAIRCEAARAAGELELREAVPLLLELIYDIDDNTRLASIWSLSQIGGEGVQDELDRLYDEAEDEEELDFIEAALDNLEFTESLNFLPFLDFSELDEETLDDDFEGMEDLDEDLY
jgi:HEAT repeat protein